MNSPPPGMMPPVGSDTDFPTDYRIGPTAFTASIFAFLAVAILVAASSLWVRIRRSGRLGLHDAFMVVALVCFAASAGLTQAARDLTYIQMDVNTGRMPPPPDFVEKMLMFVKLNTAESMLQWSTIFAVKFSYMIFFRPLISRVQVLTSSTGFRLVTLRTWWWIVMGILIPSAAIIIFMAIYVCGVFDMTFISKCLTNGLIIAHEDVFLKLTTGIDIFTDILVISIPIFLLSRVQLELRRKLALGVVLCLSVFMIIIAALRFSLCPVPTVAGDNTIPDTLWLFFWQSMEALVAITMVSATAFRSLYGQRQRRRDRKGYDYKTPSSNRSDRSAGEKGGKSSGKNALAGAGDLVSDAEEEEEMRVLSRARTGTIRTSGERRERERERETLEGNRPHIGDGERERLGPGRGRGTESPESFV